MGSCYPKRMRGTSKLGAVSELAVCADMLSKGYEVFRAVSPSCSVDLIAQKDGKIFRVEVKTGWKNPKTNAVYPNMKNIPADILVVVIPEENEIHYKSLN